MSTVKINYGTECSAAAYESIKFPEELPDSCIEFNGTLFSDGYGAVYDITTAKTLKAHRLAYCKSKNIVLADIKSVLIMHTCDNRACINPKHLVAGTHKDNNADRETKGRSADRKGANCPTAKLTVELVREIRIAKGTCIQIGAKYGVSAKCVNNIQNRITWKNVV